MVNSGRTRRVLPFAFSPVTSARAKTLRARTCITFSMAVRWFYNGSAQAQQRCKDKPAQGKRRATSAALGPRQNKLLSPERARQLVPPLQGFLFRWAESQGGVRARRGLALGWLVGGPLARRAMANGAQWPVCQWLTVSNNRMDTFFLMPAAQFPRRPGAACLQCKAL